MEKKINFVKNILRKIKFSRMNFHKNIKIIKINYIQKKLNLNLFKEAYKNNVLILPRKEIDNLSNCLK